MTRRVETHQRPDGQWAWAAFDDDGQFVAEGFEATESRAYTMGCVWCGSNLPRIPPPPIEPQPPLSLPRAREERRVYKRLLKYLDRAAVANAGIPFLSRASIMVSFLVEIVQEELDDSEPMEDLSLVRRVQRHAATMAQEWNGDFGGPPRKDDGEASERTLRRRGKGKRSRSKKTT
jgi:hypothetical protein